MSTLSISTIKPHTASALRARAGQAGNGRAAGAAHAGQRAAPEGGAWDGADIRRLLGRLGLRWTRGASPERRAAVGAVRPYLDRLREADRALTKASLDARLATGRVTVLEASVAKHLRRRDELVQQVLHSRHEAASQKSSSRGAALRRTSGEWEQELREYDEKFGGRPNELATARSDAYDKQAELRLRKKQVCQLEAAIGHLLSSVTRPDDGGSGAAPGGRVAGGGNGALEYGHPSVRPQDPGSVARVRAEHPAGRGAGRRTNGREGRQAGPAVRTRREEIARDRRR